MGLRLLNDELKMNARKLVELLYWLMKSYIRTHYITLHLCFQNNADTSLMDVDGNFAYDHAPPGSMSQHHMQKYLDQKGKC